MVREEVMTFSEAYPLSDCFKRYLKIKTVCEKSPAVKCLGSDR